MRGTVWTRHRTCGVVVLALPVSSVVSIRQGRSRLPERHALGLGVPRGGPVRVRGSLDVIDALKRTVRSALETSRLRTSRTGPALPTRNYVEDHVMDVSGECRAVSRRDLDAYRRSRACSMARGMDELATPVFPEGSGGNRARRGARAGGCRIPGREVPATWCEVHRVSVWARGADARRQRGPAVSALPPRT
jgi:hypothetical protein